jgi:hypothetical protein
LRGNTRKAVFSKEIFYMSITNTLSKSKAVAAIVPVVIDGTKTNSVVIDRLGYQSAYINLSYSACVGGGAPSAAALSFKVYSNSASSTSSPAPVLLATLEASLDILLAGLKTYAVDLSAAKQYIFVEYDSTLTGGTTPSNIVSCQFVLSDKNVLPANGVETIYGR